MKNLRLRAVIIDDEVTAILMLIDLLGALSTINIAGTATNLNDGINLIKTTQPDIVFLDINMPDRNGLEIYNDFKNPPFKIIFCTAYQQYAIKVVGKPVSGYLLKPLDVSELQKTLNKVTEEIEHEQAHLQLEEKINITNTPEMAGDNILLDVEHGFILGNTRNIVYCYAKNSYSMVVMNTQKEVLVPKSLKELQILLPVNQFYRTHKSFLINIFYIQKFVRGKENYVLLESGTKIPVALRTLSVFSKDIKKKLME